MLQVKASRTVHKPYQVFTNIVVIHGYDQLTPRAARAALEIAFGQPYGGTVMSMDGTVGYRVYQHTARKLKPEQPYERTLEAPESAARSVEFVNLTPHEITVYHADVQRLAFRVPPSGQVARVQEETVQATTLNGVPVYRTKYGDVAGLPAPQPGVAYIVSQMILNAVPDRRDLYAPGPLLRDGDGRVVGCVGLRSL